MALAKFTVEAVIGFSASFLLFCAVTLIFMSLAPLSDDDEPIEYFYAVILGLLGGVLGISKTLKTKLAETKHDTNKEVFYNPVEREVEEGEEQSKN